MFSLDFHFVLKIIGVIIIAVIGYNKWSFSYFKRKKIPYMKPTFLFGNITEIFTTSRPGFEIFTDFYRTMKSKGHKHAGFYAFTKPVYVVLDLDYVKNIMLKDYQFFNTHGQQFDERYEPLSANLFTVDGERWKGMRAKMTPAFTSGKMKMISPTVLDCALPLKKEIARLHEAKKPLDVYDLVASFSIDVVGSCFFGIDCNSFKYPDAEFKRYAQNLFTLGTTGTLNAILVFCWPKIAFPLGLRVIRKEATDFFISTVKNTVDYRQRMNVRRNDIMQTFIDLMAGDESITCKDIVSQVFMLFVAGHETTSLTVTHCMFELAKNQSIQDKVRREVITMINKYDGEITYEGLVEMKYLEQAIYETLRMYPPASLLVRKCLKDYQMPGTEVTIDRGTLIVIPNYGIQNDPEYYPEPETFDPDRFFDRQNIVPFTFLPFGDGPRICLAIRMAMMEIKIAISAFVKDYKVRLHPSGAQKITHDPNSLILRSKDTVLLEIEAN